MAVEGWPLRRARAAQQRPSRGTAVSDVHMNLLHRAYFLAASADELGLSARPIGPDGERVASGGKDRNLKIWRR